MVYPVPEGAFSMHVRHGDKGYDLPSLRLPIGSLLTNMIYIFGQYRNEFGVVSKIYSSGRRTFPEEPNVGSEDRIFIY